MVKTKLGVTSSIVSSRAETQRASVALEMFTAGRLKFGEIIARRTTLLPMRPTLLLIPCLATLACSHPDAVSSSRTTSGAVSSAAPQSSPALRADLGKAAPDFTLPDTEGHPVHLADVKGKIVVLEWFNPHCPYVNKAHTKGSLK